MRPYHRARAVTRALVLWSSVTGATASALPAQTQSQERLLALSDSVVPRSARGNDVMTRLITVRLQDAPVEQALRQVASLGSARLAYSNDLIPRDVRVSLTRERITLGDAFREVLRETDLDIVATPSGYVILVRSPWPKARLAAAPDSVPTIAAPLVRTTRAQVMDRVLVMGTPASGASERGLASAVTVRSFGQLTQHGLTNMSQVFRTSIPGVVSWDLGIAGPLAQVGSVRGSSSFSSNYLKTYVDGVELASPYLLFAIDPYSIDRIEVIRGPQGSAMYGSDAISGVVQVVTRKGSPSANWRPQFDASATFGRQESRYTSGPSAIQRHSAMAFTGGGTTSLGVGGTWEDVGPVVTGGSAGSRGVFGGGRTFAGPLRLETTFRYADIRFSAPDNPLFSQVTDAAAASVRPFLAQQRIENETYGVTADFQPSTWWRQTLVLGLDRHNGAIPPQREPATVADALLGATREAASKSSIRYSMAARLVSTGDANMTATLGAEGSTFLRDRLGFRAQLVGTGTGLTSLYNETVHNSGVFGQLKLDLANTVFVSAGLRGERNSNFGQNVKTAYSPMLGIAVTHDAGEASVKVRAAYGKGIRPPQPSMRQAIRTLSFRQLANPELEPEVQSGTEAGVEVYLGDRLNLSVTAYAQNAEGLIQQVVTNPRERVRTIQYQNVGRITNTGVELEGSARAGLLRADLSFSRTNSRVRGLASTYTGDLVVNDRVPEVPTSAGTVSVSAEQNRVRAMAGVNYIGGWAGYDWISFYSDELGTDSARPLLRDYLIRYPSLTRPFVGLSYTMSRFAEWYLRVDNLTNIQRNERDNLQIGAGRTASVGLRIAR